MRKVFLYVFMCLISDDDVDGCVHTSSVDGCVAVSAVKVECGSCLKGVLFRFVERLSRMIRWLAFVQVWRLPTWFSSSDVKSAVLRRVWWFTYHSVMLNTYLYEYMRRSLRGRWLMSVM